MFEFAIAKIAITKMYDDVKIPRKATVGSIGADVFAYIKSERGTPLKNVIPPGTTRMIPTGIVAVAEPPFSIFVCSRSGMAAQRTLFVTNAPGIVDPDYRGEIKILMHNGGTTNQWIEHGDKIAQLVLVPCPVPEIEESPLDLRKLTTIRGDKGFGSTGV